MAIRFAHDRGGITALEYAVVTAVLTGATVSVAYGIGGMLIDFVARLGVMLA